jgi:hypothetical protein
LQSGGPRRLIGVYAPDHNLGILHSTACLEVKVAIDSFTPNNGEDVEDYDDKKREKKAVQIPQKDCNISSLTNLGF